MNAIASGHGAPEESSGNDTGGEAREGGPERGDSTDQTAQTAPVESSGAAYNRLAPILSMLIRTAQLTNKEVNSRIGCSPSYLSRILSGERVPTWALTRKSARTCGADPQVLRTVWESAKLSAKSREPALPPDELPMPAAERLRTAVHTLHLRAGCSAPAPSPPSSTPRSCRTPTSSRPSSAYGDVDHLQQLLNDARRETTEGTALLHSGPDPHPEQDLAALSCTSRQSATAAGSWCSDRQVWVTALKVAVRGGEIVMHVSCDCVTRLQDLFTQVS
ncbi:helix-turn-helix domain-containing protein [Streptomyces sp. YIM B13508]|uniref:helix-turn-helix domain-containing protein n=1 Tax=Streptomyces sp. YIM B13508 TaxID=3366315 RepID=UPI0036B79621